MILTEQEQIAIAIGIVGIVSATIGILLGCEIAIWVIRKMGTPPEQQ
jgi:hypothetical protein